MGLLGDGWDDPRSAAVMALAGGLLSRNLGQGLLASNNAYAVAKEGVRRDQLAQAQLQETLAQAEERKMHAAQMKAAQEQQARWQAALPGLFRTPGVTGGEAVPQEVGGVPMFSKPMGVTPTRATPGGFDVQQAIALRMPPKMIEEYAALTNVGRPEVARTIETMRNGRPVTLQVDKFGNVVGEAQEQWKAPVFQNLGDRHVALDPVTMAARASFPVGMSPSERDASARGWAGHNLSQQRFTLERDNATAGKVPSGYRAKGDGSLEFIPGGPADPNAARRAAPTEDERKAAGWLAQAQKGLADMKAAVQADPSASRPSVIEALPFIPENTVNMTRSASRQMFNQGASALGEAVLRAATGAGVNRDEAMQKARELTPQWGDSEQVIRQKELSAENYIKALEVRAGRGLVNQGNQPNQAENDPLGLRR